VGTSALEAEIGDEGREIGRGLIRLTLPEARGHKMMKAELTIMMEHRAEPGKQGNPGNFCKWLWLAPKLDQNLTVEGRFFRRSGFDPRWSGQGQPGSSDKLYAWLLPIPAKGSADGAVRR
jgi:hypothetical protein